MIELKEIIESEDDIITRWDMTGLLEDIPDNERADIAHSLHAAALYLSDDDVDAKISALFISIVRKIYGLNKCVVIKFKVLELMIESAIWWAQKLHNTRKKSFREKLATFFAILNLSSPSGLGQREKIESEQIEAEQIEEHVVEQVSIDYTEKFCRHGNAKPIARNWDCGEPLNYCQKCWISNAEKKKQKSMHIKLCEHGKGMTDYCLPCHRVNNA